MLLQPAADYTETPGIVSSSCLYAALPRNVVKMQPLTFVDRFYDALGTEDYTVFICIYQLSQDFLQLSRRILFGSFLSPAAKYIICMMVMMMVMVMVVMVVVTAAIWIVAFMVVVMMMLMLVMMFMLVVVVAMLMLVVMMMMFVLMLYLCYRQKLTVL